MRWLRPTLIIAGCLMLASCRTPQKNVPGGTLASAAGTAGHNGSGHRRTTPVAQTTTTTQVSDVFNRQPSNAVCATTAKVDPPKTSNQTHAENPGTNQATAPLVKSNSTAKEPTPGRPPVSHAEAHSNEDVDDSTTSTGRSMKVLNADTNAVAGISLWSRVAGPERRIANNPEVLDISATTPSASQTESRSISLSACLGSSSKGAIASAASPELANVKGGPQESLNLRRPFSLEKALSGQNVHSTNSQARSPVTLKPVSVAPASAPIEIAVARLPATSDASTGSAAPNTVSPVPVEKMLDDKDAEAVWRESQLAIEAAERKARQAERDNLNRALHRFLFGD